GPGVGVGPRANNNERRSASGWGWGPTRIKKMTVHTDYLWFNTPKRQEFVRITDEIARIVGASGVVEGMVLVSAMHITAAVYVNDWEDGLIGDFQEWLEKLAPAGKPY